MESTIVLACPSCSTSYHRFCDKRPSEQDALELAISTWPEGITG